MIRPANREDTDALIALLRACRLYNPTLDYREWSHPTLVCETDGKIIGMCQVLLGQPYAYMTEIGVHPDYQDKGIGKQLVNAMEAIMKDCGITHWCSIAMAWNENSKKRVEHIGAEIKGAGYAYLKRIN